MLIIPAVDLHQGKCVRLTQGKLDYATVYSTDPVFVAKLWQTYGAKRLHLIDLDGAHCGIVQHWDIIKKIRSELNILIEFGGGVRKLKTVEELVKIGIDKIILSTILVTNSKETEKILKKFRDKIIAAVDVYEGKILIGGWKEHTPVDAKEFMKKIFDLGIKEMILTDIKQEGLLQGINLEMIYELVKDTELDVIISGGITSLEDIKKIKDLGLKNIVGVIIGKALYAETIKFEDALKIAES